MDIAHFTSSCFDNTCQIICFSVWMELFAQTMSHFNLRVALKPVSEIQIIIVLNLTINLWLSVDVQDLLTTILNIEALKGQTCIL